MGYFLDISAAAGESEGVIPGGFNVILRRPSLTARTSVALR